MTGAILTPEGKKKLEEELAFLKEVRKTIIERIARAKELGDLSENAEYHSAREEQAFNEGKIQEIEHTLKTANVVQTKGKKDSVQLGSSVTVQVGDSSITYTIVGSNETSIQEKKISIDSPVARALLGKKSGDLVEVVLPAGVRQFKIEKIS